MRGNEKPWPPCRAVKPPIPEDAELLHAITEGDRTALATLYDRHGGVLLAHLRLVTGDHFLSEEVLQDTMLAVWTSASRFRGDSSVRSWMISIARRQARDRLRRHRFRLVGQDALADQAAADPGPEEIALDRAKVGAVAHAIRTLPVQHRETFDLVFGAGLPLAEAASVLGIPVGTVKSRLSAARIALTRALAEKGFA